MQEKTDTDYADEKRQRDLKLTKGRVQWNWFKLDSTNDGGSVPEPDVALKQLRCYGNEKKTRL